MHYLLWSSLIAIFFCLIVPAANVSAQDSQLTSPAPAASKPFGKLSSRLYKLSGIANFPQMSASAKGKTLHLPSAGPGSLKQDKQGRVMVYIRMNDLSDEQIRALLDGGVQIVHVSDRYKVVTAYVMPSSMSHIAGLSAVENMMEVLSPAHSASYACPQGINVSEGDNQLNAALARSTYGLSGSGVTVGILSDSYDTYTSAVTRASADILSGDLPGTSNPCGYNSSVNVLADYSGSYNEDEGRGMMQIVHDLAPGSVKSFATADNGLPSFADNIRALHTAGAGIIVDDILYYAEPFFQEGPVNVAISDVVSAGALYFTAATNQNLIIGGHNISSYEAPSYRPTTCPTTISGYGYADCHNFDPSGGTSNTSSVTLISGCQINIDFQWNEPWYGVATDLDIFLLNSTGTIVAYSDNNNASTKEPFEFLSYPNGNSTATYYIVIGRHSGTGTPRLKYMFMQNGWSCISGVQYNTSNGGDIVGPTVEGHSATSDGFSVAAVPYSDSTTPEYYSSRGPATHYFGPVVGTTPASAITATTLQQPDFAATDGGCTTFFGGYSAGCYRFYGTSAAAPHAAAVTALLKQEANQLSIPLTRMVTKYVLQSTSQTVINGDINSVGSGLISASAAVNQLINLKPVILVAGSTIVGSYTLVSPAYTDSITGDTIEMRATSFAGDLAFNSNKSITLKGGYAAGYATQNGTTTINGKLTISNGSVVIDKVVLN